MKQIRDKERLINSLDAITAGAEQFLKSLDFIDELKIDAKKLVHKFAREYVEAHINFMVSTSVAAAIHNNSQNKEESNAKDAE